MYNSIYAIVSLVCAILTIILFFKIWGMCNNVKEILENITPKTDNKEIMKLIVAGKYDEAECLLNDILAKNVLRIFYLETNYYQDNISDEKIMKRLERVIQSLEPFYQTMGRTIPEKIKNATPEDVRKWYKLSEELL